jgi:heptosyltransferase-2
VKREHTGSSTTCRSSRRGILVLAPNWLGDAVMATPFLYALRRKHPERDIHLLCRSYTAPIFRLCPAVDGLAEYERRTGISGAIRALGGGVPELGREICFILPGSFSSALVALISRATRRVGYGGQFRSILLTDALPVREYRSGHLSSAYVRLLELVTGEREKDIPLPVVVPPYGWEDSIESKGLTPGYIVLSPGAEYGAAKMWPAGRYADLASRLAKRTRADIVIVGSEKEQEVANEIVSKAGAPARSLAGRCSIDELLCVLRGASLIVGNDSGPVHICAAMGIPTLAIFGSTSPSWTSPRGRSVEIMRAALDCSPCFERECPQGEPRCMLDIDVGDVLESACRMIGEDSREEARRND